MFFVGLCDQSHVAFVRALWGQSGAKDAPRCAKSAQKVPQTSLLGAQSVTFRCQVGESGPLLKHAQGLCFHHKIRVRAPPFLVLHWPRGRTAHRDCSFSHFWLHFGRQSDAQGRPKAGQGSPKGPKGLPKPPPGRLKIIQKSTWGPTLGPGGSRGAPGRGNDAKIDGKTTILVAKVPERGRAFRLVFEVFLV